MPLYHGIYNAMVQPYMKGPALEPGPNGEKTLWRYRIGSSEGKVYHAESVDSYQAPGNARMCLEDYHGDTEDTEVSENSVRSVPPWFDLHPQRPLGKGVTNDQRNCPRPRSYPAQRTCPHPG